MQQASRCARFVSSAGRVSPAGEIAPLKAASHAKLRDLCEYGSYEDAVWCSSFLAERYFLSTRASRPEIRL